jgi:hypothetical protein
VERRTCQQYYIYREQPPRLPNAPVPSSCPPPHPSLLDAPEPVRHVLFSLSAGSWKCLPDAQAPTSDTKLWSQLYCCADCLRVRPDTHLRTMGTWPRDIRACSLVLFSMSERSSWVRKYRDAFEILVNAAMTKLRNGSHRLSGMVAAQYQSSQTQNKSEPAQDGGGVSGNGGHYGQEQTYGQQRTPPTVTDPMMYNLVVNTADELNGGFYDLPQSSCPGSHNSVLVAGRTSRVMCGGLSWDWPTG